MDTPGLVMLFTGNGKGKTTAAFGQALRAAGHGLSVCIIQFIKKNKATGEVLALAALADRIEVHTTGSGFTWTATNKDEVVRAAAAGWQLARDKMRTNVDMIILDEFTYLLEYQLIDEAVALHCFRQRRPGQHLVITGRNASASLVELADMVTEMRQIKHPFHSGIKARQGIEY